MGKTAVSRRGFLGSASGAIAAAAVVGSAPATKGEAAASSFSSEETSHKKKKIPIGVFDPAYPDLSLDQMLDNLLGPLSRASLRSLARCCCLMACATFVSRFRFRSHDDYSFLEKYVVTSRFVVFNLKA